MLSKKFEGRKNIYFEWTGDVKIAEAKKVREEGGAVVYGIKARDYTHACQIDKLLADSGKEYEVWG